MRYITCKTFNGKGISGMLKISKGSAIEVTDTGFLTHNEDLICAVSSQNAYDHFARNDDGNGMERFVLTHGIIADLSGIMVKANQAAIEMREGGEASEEQIDACYAKYDEAIAYIKANHPSFIRENGSWSFEFYNADVSGLSDVSEKVKSLK